MHPDVAWAVWSGERARRVESVIDRLLPPANEPPQRLHEAMRYAVLGGKRVRALLAYAAGELTAADPAVVDRPAAAVELIHAYSLVHDDLPCMDDDVLRRGKPTCHVAFGEATALLAGDALQACAFEALAAGDSRDPGHAVLLLARAVGSRGMAGGQEIDLAAAGQSLDLAELEHMHRLKTGALIRAAVRLGADCGRPVTADENDALHRYASAIGLAFQVVDDVLDVEGTAQSLGKTAGKDAAQRKSTYATLMGLTAARQRIETLRIDARSALSGFGAGARRLGELADWIAERTH
ncbi:MAG: polyprenyl synthetase family protein [Pseudomonadota bacterium]|nr:polyprenyl synthetase family protein [Pseudomonadota bacterium]